MDIHEYQAKDLFRAAGIPVPPGEIAQTPGEARRIADELGGRVVVKAQVHIGGRGKAGGVRLASSAAEAESHAADILGMDIKGLTVGKVLVTRAEEIASEAYVAVLIDRRRQSPVFMVSPEGGVDIEEVAAERPGAILRLPVDPRYGLLAHQAFRLADFLYTEAGHARQAARIMGQLYRVFTSNSCSLAEINPLIVTATGQVRAIDAKVSLDDAGMKRLPELEALRDTSSEPESETRARQAGLSFVKLDGDVGCCVNGAGLAMATMDLVKYYGGRPANFLDIGGSSNPDKVVAALEIIASDPHVKVILFNIFGGITRCDDVARGIVEARSRTAIGPPLVIRLSGTNEAEAIEILGKAGLAAYSSMDQVVKRAVRMAGSA